MCVICLKKAEAKVTSEEIEKMWVTNPDGAGYSFIHNEKLILRKGFMKLKHFLKAWGKDCETYDIMNKLCVMHFRIGTHGGKNQANTHPFAVSDDLVMVHNGVLTGLDVPVNGTKSDTNVFTGLLKRLPSHWIEAEAIRGVVESYVKPSSKLCFLRSDGYFWIANEEKGEWKDGRWFSNMYWSNRTVYEVVDTKIGFQGSAAKDSVDGLTDEEFRKAYFDQYGIPYDDDEIESETYYVRCDCCEASYSEDVIIVVGEFKFCSECFSSMSQSEINVYKGITEMKHTKEEVKDEDVKKAIEVTLTCPLCKQIYTVGGEDADAVWCDDCRHYFDKNGTLDYC